MSKVKKKPVRKVKRPPGRPPKPDHQRKDRWLNDVRFSAEELDMLRARAADSGLTWTEFVRGKLGL